jgi:hypothetical protein
MNGVASGLIEAFKIAINPDDPTNTGTPWDSIPTGGAGWFKYGGGGIVKWGTICGVPNGICAVLSLMGLHGSYFEGSSGPNITDQLMRYYSQTVFPVDGLYDLAVADDWANSMVPCATWPGAVAWGSTHLPLPDDEVLAHTIADSPLCHISVSKWADAAGVNLTKGEYGGEMKEDRCGKIVADMAGYVAEWLNYAELDVLYDSAETVACMSCHNLNSDAPAIPAQQGIMECGACHDMAPNHGSKKGGPKR